MNENQGDKPQSSALKKKKKIEITCCHYSMHSHSSMKNTTQNRNIFKKRFKIINRSLLSQHISELRKTFGFLEKIFFFINSLIIKRTCTFYNFQSPKAQYFIRMPISSPCYSRSKRQGTSTKKNSKFYGQNHQSFKKRGKETN